jgi:ATP-dependent Clp protease adaptor protein ClpS
MTTENVLEKTPKIFDKSKLPKKYKVIILNDNHTPAEFVIVLLMKIYRHPESIAKEITMKIHNEGSGVAGIYNYEVAEQKLFESINLSRSNNFPLELKLEPE